MSTWYFLSKINVSINIKFFILLFFLILKDKTVEAGKYGNQRGMKYCIKLDDEGENCCHQDKWNCPEKQVPTVCETYGAYCTWCVQFTHHVQYVGQRRLITYLLGLSTN